MYTSITYRHIAHLLRIDIEDASVAVMKSLLQPLHSYELPLLVMVEIKSTKRGKLNRSNQSELTTVVEVTNSYMSLTLTQYFVAVSANGWDSECDDTSEFLLSK